MSDAKKPWEETWRTRNRSDCQDHIVKANGSPIYFHPALTEDEDPLMPGRAALAAAAPDLYRALEAILLGEDGYCRCCEHTVGGSREHSFNCAGFNALRKARGEDR